MANFTLETTRNTAFQNFPRLTFQPPQSTTSTTPSTTSPILFCQRGCDLEFKFKNLTSAKLKNDGTYFTIIPPDNSDNYINWSGSGKAGFDLIRFDLKEIKIIAPAKDVVGSITYNKSIQMYFSFVNSDENKKNIMIVISVIGQANNVGNAQTDGFILLNALANQIPLRNDIKDVSNLGNVNLGNLLPASKAFFSTLINDQSINYISMARIIDIPVTFLNNMISRVVGGDKAYQSKVNQNTQQIPSNPEGTVIFYSENIKAIGPDQAYVCNANCDRVVGDANLLEPTFGSSSTTRSTGAPLRPGAPGIRGVPPKEEICEEEYVYPGTRTAVKVKSASEPAVATDKTTDKSNENELTSSETAHIIYMVLFGIGILVGTVAIFIFMAKASDVTSVRGFFSRELWNVPNIPFILAGLIGSLSLIIGVAISMDMYNKENNSVNKSEEGSKQWIGLIVGGSIYILCFIPLVIFAFRAKKNAYSSFRNSSSNYSSSSFTQQNPFALPINPSLPDFNPTKMKSFNTQADSLLSSYKSAPSQADFFKPGSKGIQDILNASKQYSQLPEIAKNTLAKYNPSLAPYLEPKGQFIQNIKSGNLEFPAQESLKSLIDSLKYYNLLRQANPVITPELINKLIKYQKSAKNSNLEQIIKGLTVGAPIPIEVYKYVAKI
jgi:succinate dehydrogenase hydrophobic anchor subunit